MRDEFRGDASFVPMAELWRFTHCFLKATEWVWAPEIRILDGFCIIAGEKITQTSVPVESEGIIIVTLHFQPCALHSAVSTL